MQFDQLKRREFITLLGGAAAAWPLAVSAQEVNRPRRIGILMGAANDPEGQARAKSFEQSMDRIGWATGRMSGSIIAGAHATIPNRHGLMRSNSSQ